jgi:hypothetical protein
MQYAKLKAFKNGIKCYLSLIQVFPVAVYNKVFSGDQQCQSGVEIFCPTSEVVADRESL